MKQCPACRKIYTDDLSFCLEDGSTLASPGPDEREVETRFARRPIAAGKRSRVLAYTVTIVLTLAGGLVLVAAGLGGYIYYHARADRAVNVPPTNSATPKLADNSNTEIRTPDIFGPEYANTLNARANTANSRKPTPALNKSGDDPPRINDTDGPAYPNVVESNQEPANRSRKPVPKQISGGVLNGKAISLPKPPYPPAARAVRASGAVSVQVLVNESGNVVSASAVSGHPLLRASAVQAARAARFEPTTLSGQAVKVSGVLTYNFVP